MTAAPPDPRPADGAVADDDSVVGPDSAATRAEGIEEQVDTFSGLNDPADDDVFKHLRPTAP